MLRPIAVFYIVVASAFSQPAIPDTPAGHTLQAWLDAFNSGDLAKLEAYVKTIDPSQSVESMLSFRRQTGGFELLSIESSEPLHIRFRVKEKGGPTTALGSFLVKDGNPPTVQASGLRAVPPGVAPVNVTLDAALRKRVVAGVNASLAEYYVDAPLAKQMAQALDEHQKAGDYDRITDGDAFADRLTKDLRAVSHDRHLGVNFSPFKAPDQQGPTPEQLAQMRERMRRGNCAFQKVEILFGNIGYIKFDGFGDPATCAPTATAAMDFVAHADALIFDLRDNGGGDPAMVAFVASYLFDQRTHLNDLYNRRENSTEQYWTLPYVPGDRMPKQPVFVLTSSHTFSGGEEFCYDLKTQKRATIVGETTGGGAHPVGGHTVADYFTIGVPFAKAVNPITKTNWEGTGVEPDVKVSAADALTTAERLAAEKIQAESHK
jgi:Peptidase family S41/N-terminal domain of Peptidase_S41 in eukaryotic IRBP